MVLILYKDFNMLTLIREIKKRDKNGGKYALYKCDCGKECEIRISSVKTGNTNSCGCGRYSSKYGLIKKIPEYRIWTDIKTRCYNKNHSSYSNYGGRGIKMCDRWLESFDNFFEDMGKRPSKKYTLDRINNDGNYEKYNCRWATQSQQCRNQRRNHLITHNNKTQTLIDWVEELNLDYNLLERRLNHNKWSFEKAISTPCRVGKNIIEYKDEKYTLWKFSIKYNIDYSYLKYRLKIGETIEQIVEIKLYDKNNTIC